LALLLLIRSALARLEAKRAERQMEELARAVSALQAALLPHTGGELNGVAVSTAYKPAEGPAGGGDFCDVFPLPQGKVGVVVGDVNGHGETALPKTALLHFALRTYLSAGLCPRAALAAAATTLEPQLDGNLATALLAVLDPQRRTLLYAAAGHPEPVVAGEADWREPIAASPPLGSGLRTGLRQTELELQPGATVCFFTDGVIDCSQRDGKDSGSTLATALSQLDEGQADATSLLDRLAREGRARRDDMALCLLTLPGKRDHCQPPAKVLAQELAADEEVAGSLRPAIFLTALGLDCEKAAEALRRLRALRENGAVSLLRVAGLGEGEPRVTVEPQPPAPSALLIGQEHHV